MQCNCCNTTVSSCFFTRGGETICFNCNEELYSQRDRRIVLTILSGGVQDVKKLRDFSGLSYRDFGVTLCNLVHDGVVEFSENGESIEYSLPNGNT